MFFNSTQKIAEEYGYPNLFEQIDFEAQSNEACHAVCGWMIKHSRIPNKRSSNLQEKKFALWVTVRRRAKKGHRWSCWYPSDQAIAEEYGYPLLFDTEDLEAQSNKTCHEVCQWMRGHNNKVPSSIALDYKEKEFGRWVSNKRSTSYPSDQAIAEEYGYPLLFGSIETRSNETCRATCDWMKKHNDKVPNPHSHNLEEEKLGSWICRRRTAKKGKINGSFYPSDQAIAESYGYPRLFETEDLEALSNKMCREVCDWMKSHNNKIPTQFLSWVGRKRMAKKGKGSSWLFYSSDQAIAESYGYPLLFDTEDLEAQSNKTCHEVCQWMRGHCDKIPSQKSSEPMEKKCGTWICTRRKAEKNKKRPFYSSDQTIAKSYGYPNLFETDDPEALSNKMCREVCDWMKSHSNKMPYQKSSEPGEKKLGARISTKRLAKNNSKRPFYPSDQAIVQSYGYPDLFETKKGKL